MWKGNRKIYFKNNISKIKKWNLIYLFLFVGITVTAPNKQKTLLKSAQGKVSGKFGKISKKQTIVYIFILIYIFTYINIDIFIYKYKKFHRYRYFVLLLYIYIYLFCCICILLILLVAIMGPSGKLFR
jgi:hypothetical protein